MERKYFSILIIFVFLFLSSKGQYIQFSQYYASPTVLAPSFTGAIQNSRINLNWRDQWTKIQPAVFLTYSASFDMHAPKISSGFGFVMVRDEAGAGNLARTEFGVLYSWYGLINKIQALYFRPGVEFKITQRSVDFQKLIFPDQISPNGYPFTTNIPPYTSQVPPDQVRKFSVDATGSLLIYSKQYWAGFTMDHLFRPNEAFYDDDYRTPIKYSLFGGYKFKFSGSKYGHRSANQIQDYFFVSGYYRLQAKNDQIDIGGYWEHQPLTIGVWLRGLPYMNIMNSPNIDAVVFMVGFKLFDFTIGYSYDFTVSPLLSKTGGSHELSLSYNFYSNLKSKQRNGPLPCPGL